MSQEINEKLARLDGVKCFVKFGRKMWDHADNTYVSYPPDYRTDLNLLMPLAWKYKLDLVYVEFDGVHSDYWSCGNFDYSSYDKDPKQAIIQCLLKIAEEG